MKLPAPTIGELFAPLRNGAASDFEQIGQGLSAARTGDSIMSFHSAKKFSTLNHSGASELNESGGLIPPMTLAERVLEAIGSRKPADVARALGVSKGAVSQWRSGLILSLKAETAARMEKLTGYSATWLATGKGPKMANSGNVQSVKTLGRVPLISWVAAGHFGEIADMYQPGEAEEWEDVYETQPGEQAFALRVDGDSMTSPYPGESSFPDGSILIVDPSRSCDAGDYVIAKDVSTQQATFKKLVRDGGRWYLKPLNPSYPTIEIDNPAMRVIGRVIESTIRRKL